MTMNSVVLIVDDEPAGRDTLEALLTGQGYDLEFAADGPSALAAIAAQPPDLVLLDVMMPGMDGFEVCRRLRAEPISRELPVILVTALDDRESRLRGLDVGADDFVSKPYDRSELRARVKTTTRLNRYRCLLAERSKFTWVTQLSADGIALLDADQRIIYANPRAQLYLGLSEGAAAAGTVSFHSCVERQYRVESDAGQSAPGVPLYFVRPETPTSAAFWLRVETLHLPGEAGAHVVQLRDVTVEMTARRQVDAFHTLVSHKMRTPLNHLYGCLELLGTAAADGDAEEVTFCTTTAMQAAQRLHAQLESVMRYVDSSLLGEGGHGLALTRLGSVLEDACHTVDYPARVDIRLAPSDRCLTMSCEAFELVMMELLGNARKFHPRAAPAITVTVQEDERGQIRLNIQDDGATLSPEYLARAWTPYFQAEKCVTGEVPGMGLGLATVASTVRAAGGSCRMANRDDGPGVDVELRLPLM